MLFMYVCNGFSCNRLQKKNWVPITFMTYKKSIIPRHSQPREDRSQPIALMWRRTIRTRAE